MTVSDIRHKQARWKIDRPRSGLLDAPGPLGVELLPLRTLLLVKLAVFVGMYGLLDVLWPVS